MSKLSKKQKLQQLCTCIKNDESGNILLFSVIVLLFMVFVISIVSLSVVNRVRVVRKFADNNQVTAEASQLSQNVESSIQKIISESDELARYYVSRRYYTWSDIDFSQTGSNASLDGYLNNLIGSDFQLQIRSRMNANPLSTAECTKTVFAYLLLRRGPANVSVPELESIASAIEGNRNDKLTVVSKSITATSGINNGSPTFTQILTAVQNGNSIMEIEFKLSYDTSALLSNSKSIDTHVVYQLYSYQYVLSGIDILKPSSDDIKSVLDTQRYQISTKMSS